MTRIAAILAAFLCVASPSFASGVVSVAWDGCTGPLSKTVAPSSLASLYVSVMGQSDIHKAYQVRVLLRRNCSSPYPPLTDAWRFDEVGCQTAAALHMDHSLPDLPSDCPNFSQATQNLSIKEFTYEGLTGTARILLARSYSLVPSVDPAARYFLARFVFDHARSVEGPSVGGSCGGLEAPLCVMITYGSYLTLDGTESNWQLGNRCVSVNDPTNAAGCDVPTPARPITWGAIRGQYR